MLIRPATHAGAWYSADEAKLFSQISGFFAKAQSPQKGARILIGPHAGYSYSGQRLAETFGAWDTSRAKRVFILGPSHHVYFRDAALVSRYSYYDTPLGEVQVDTEVTQKLASLESFKYMGSSVDEDEHLFEMHAPFIAFRSQKDGTSPKIVPIMISAMSPALREGMVEALLPYLEDEENTFVILSDFCHWGRRFGYTKYVPGSDISKLGSFTSRGSNPIYKLIELLDRAAMTIATSGSAKQWDSYIESTGNTICGEKPMSVVLRLLEEYKKNGGSVGETVFEWLGYSQSGEVTLSSDSSVSYASGFVRIG